MKKTGMICSFFMFLTASVFASTTGHDGSKNLILEDFDSSTSENDEDCIALSEEHIKGLYSWGKIQQVCIGVGNNFNKQSDRLVVSQNSGLIFEKKASFSNELLLTDISFENKNEVDSSIELIAERESFEFKPNFTLKPLH